MKLLLIKCRYTKRVKSCLTLLFHWVRFFYKVFLNSTHVAFLTLCETDSAALPNRYTLAVTQTNKRGNSFRDYFFPSVSSSSFEMPHLIICLFIITNGDIYPDSYCFTRPLHLIVLDSALPVVTGDCKCEALFKS